MPTSILYRDDEMLEQSNAIKLPNRLRYETYITKIVGARTNKSDGTLKEDDFKEITYDALQKFPEEQLAKILKPAQTEIPTVDSISKEFRYNKACLAVQMIISNLKKSNTANTKASIINSLMKQWDYGAYYGTHGNLGVEGNPNIIKMAAADVGDIKALISAISKLIAEMKKDENAGITDNELSNVTIGYTSGISGLMSNVYLQGDTGMSLVKKAFPAIEFVEIPTMISKNPEDGTAREFLEGYYRPMLTLWHGAMPSQYATEPGKFGLSEDTLFTFENTAIEVEEKGAAVRQDVNLTA